MYLHETSQRSSLSQCVNIDEPRPYRHCDPEAGFLLLSRKMAGLNHGSETDYRHVHHSLQANAQENASY
jgi:hypothetical protein